MESIKTSYVPTKKCGITRDTNSASQIRCPMRSSVKLSVDAPTRNCFDRGVAQSRLRVHLGVFFVAGLYEIIQLCPVWIVEALKVDDFGLFSKATIRDVTGP